MVNTIIQSFDIWTDAQGIKSKVRVKSVDNISLKGVAHLRELIMKLAVSGKLVPQDPDEEPASELLNKLTVKKRSLIKAGKVKKTKSKLTVEKIESPKIIPDSWQAVRLSDVFDVRDGTHDSPKPKQIGYPLVTSKNLSSGKLNLSNVTYISEEDHFKISDRSKVDKGDVLFAMIGSIGNPVIVETDIEFSIKNVALFKYYSNDLSSAGYLQLFLRIAAVEMREKALGGVQSFVSLGLLRDFIFHLPPLEEQKRIVAKADELMTLCDKVEEEQTNNLKTHEVLVKTLLDTLTQVKDANELQEAWGRISTHFDTLFCTEDSVEQLKQTILQLAVMGKLVKQDPTNETASILLKKIAAEKVKLIKEGKIKKQNPLPEITQDEKPFDLPESWAWVKFDYIAKNCKSALKAGPFGSALKKSMYVEKGFKIYGQEQVISGDENLGDYYVNQEKFDTLKSCSIKPGDILISLVGTIGKVLVLSEACQPGIINPRLVKLSLYKEVNRNYIRLMLAAPFVQAELDEKSHGGTMNILNLGLIRSLVFPLPPVSEQLIIVNKVENLFAMCESLKTRIKHAQTIQGLLSKTVVEKAV